MFLGGGIKYASDKLSEKTSKCNVNIKNNDTTCTGKTVMFDGKEQLNSDSNMDSHKQTIAIAVENILNGCMVTVPCDKFTTYAWLHIHKPYIMTETVYKLARNHIDDSS